jgi:dipeptidyl aminopeptidase/acylaminoacyl peptidase
VSSVTADYYRLTYWSDGLRINGFYAEPKSPGPHPAVIYNRGGNRDTGKLTGIELAPFAEVGFVVVASQMRGGGGSEGRDEFGGADLHDVLNLIPLLKSRPSVDPERIAMIGGSRGGMMTYLALEAQTLRYSRDIKVAASVSGISDLFSWAKERPDITTQFYQEMFGVTPAQNAAPYVARSAVYWPWRIRAPILLEHGDADTTVSSNQSRRLYSLIRSYGGTARLIIYPDGEHGLGNHLGGLPEALHWFQTYIGRPGDNFDFQAHEDDIRLAQILLDEHQ